MIATVLAVDSPTALTYGPTYPGPRCAVHGCGSAPGHLPGSSATATPGIALKAPGMEMKGGGTGRAIRPGRAARGALLGYQIVHRWPAGFIAVITIARVTKPGTWSLRFAFPAARVDRVWGARWQPSGDGGTADGPLSALRHSPWTRGLDADQVMVSATGRPGTPSGCVLDGIRCRFG
jgi:hypothetical protein